MSNTPPNVTPIAQAVPDNSRLTVELMECEMALRCYTARLNLITGNIDIDAQTTRNRPMDMDDLTTTMHSALSGKYKGVSLDVMRAYIALVAKDLAYNPVIDMLNSLTWDGVDRFPEVFELLGVNDDELSQVLVRKWLYQAVALLFNDMRDPFGADGVLVFNGAQGVGKTSFFRHLAINPAWFLEGATIKDNDKDTTRRIVTRWISELGEVESTLKSDISALKAFVTSDVDTYRRPYGRADIERPRYTSLCATCNSDRYLIDQTGNRRWWTVPIRQRIPYDAIQQLDALQLWAQIYATVEPLPYDQKKKCFRLTPEQARALDQRNGDVEKFLKGEEECRDIIDTARNTPGTIWEYMTITQWRTRNLAALGKYSAGQIGQALQHIGIKQEQKRLGGSKSPSRVYLLPSFTETIE